MKKILSLIFAITLACVLSAQSVQKFQVALKPTAVQTGPYSAAVNDLVPVDTTAGAVTITLPTAPPDQSTVSVKQVIQGSTNAVSVVTGGSDVFNRTGGGTTFTISLSSQGATFQYSRATAIWYVVSDDLPRGSLLAYPNIWTGVQQFGTIGGAVGKLSLAGSTSGSTLLNAAAVAGSTTTTLPNANSILPIYPQQMTYTGMTAARTVTYPDANFSVARIDAGQTFTGNEIFSGTITGTAAFPQITLGANTTTKGGIKMFGNTSGDVTIGPLAVAGTATLLTLPAVSGGLVASVTAIPTVTGTPSSSNFLRGDGTWATPSGSISGLTTSAIVTAASATTIQTPSATATMDTSGNISTPGSLTVGNAATTAGAIALTQGTTQSTGTTNVTIQAPTAVTSYIRTLPSAVGSTGYVKETVSGSVQTESVVTTIPAADVASGALVNGMTATTQSASDNSTKVATTAYADRAARVQATSVNLGNLTGTINIDWSAGTTFRGVLTGNTTFTFSNGTDGQTIIVDVAQTGTNTFTVTWPSMKWPGGTAPTMTTGAATDDITTIVDFNAVFKGNSVQNVK